MDPEPEPDIELLPLFPLPRFALLPHTLMPLHVFEPRYVRLVRDTLKESRLVGMVHLADEWEENYFAAPPLRPIGCVGRIVDVTELPEGRMNIMLLGTRKFRVMRERPGRPYRRAEFVWIDDQHSFATSDAADRAVARVLELLDATARIRNEEPGHTDLVTPELPFAAKMNRLALAARLDPDEFVGVLEVSDVYARGRRLERILGGRVEAFRRAKRYGERFGDDATRN